MFDQLRRPSSHRAPAPVPEASPLARVKVRRPVHTRNPVDGRAASVLQRKSELTVGAPHDALEQEADSVADRAVEGRRPAHPISSASALGTRANAVDAERGVGPDADAMVSRAEQLGDGRPLPDGARARMESALGHDFGEVRVHTGAASASAASAIHARAFTIGTDIHFAQGKFAPETASGSRLLAHELTHVVQQAKGPPGAQRVQRDTYSPLPATAALDPFSPSSLLTFAAGMAGDLERAHQIYLKTGTIAQTAVPWSWIEIKQGRPMSRAERYDAMAKKLGKTADDIPKIDDISFDNRDPEYLTRQEFKDEFYARHRREWDQCEDDHFFLWKGDIHACQRGVDEKYGGESYKAYRDAKELRTAIAIQQYSQRAEAMEGGGLLSLIGRGVGRAIGGDKGEEWGALIGGLGDVASVGLAATKAGGGVEEYQGGAGLEVGRATTTEVAPGREPMPTPDPITPVPEPTPPKPSLVPDVDSAERVGSQTTSPRARLGVVDPDNTIRPVSPGKPPPEPPKAPNTTPPTGATASNENIAPASQKQQQRVAVGGAGAPSDSPTKMAVRPRAPRPDVERSPRKPDAGDVLNPPRTISEHVDEIDTVHQTEFKPPKARKTKGDPAPKSPLTEQQIIQQVGNAVEPGNVQAWARTQPASASVYTNAELPPEIRNIWPKTRGAAKSGPDAIAIDPDKREITVYDDTSKQDRAHVAETYGYAEALKKNLPDRFKGYKIFSQEGWYDGGLVFSPKHRH